MNFGVIFLFALYGSIQCKLINLSCKEIRQFVDGHNIRRLQLATGQVPGQPAASNMKHMIWDEELATKARKWAAKNIFDHNPNSKIVSGRFETGENLFWFSTSDPNYEINVDQALESWFGEYENFSYGPLKPSHFDRSSGIQIGHYTQMAWADTVYLGCAISQYWEQTYYNSFLVVCNYGPAGNYIGRTPYDTKSEARGTLACDMKDCSHPYGHTCSN